jgi:hypothetical protein
MEAKMTPEGGVICPPNEIDRALSEHEALIAATAAQQERMFGPAPKSRAQPVPLGPAPHKLEPKEEKPARIARNTLYRLPVDLHDAIEELRQSQLGPPSRNSIMRELLRAGLTLYPGRTVQTPPAGK